MTQQKNALARISDFVDGAFSAEEIAVIRESVAPQSRGEPPLSNAELCVYLKQAARAKLDPFSKQIYAIRRGGRLTIQVGIDGLRAIAERTGTYAGSDDYRYESDEKSKTPKTATCTVYRLVGGQRVPTTRTVRWAEFGGSGGQWAKMPYHMLGKVAEAHALRAAFPQDLSGLYSEDEMAQADRAPADAQDADYTMRAAAAPAPAGTDVELETLKAQADLEGREFSTDEPAWDEPAQPPAPGGAS